MKRYDIPQNGALDLEHLMFVGEVFENWGWTTPWLFHIELAFGVDRHIGFDTKEEAEAARAALIKAWENK